MDPGTIAVFIPILGIGLGLVAILGGQRIEREKIKLKQIQAAAVAGDSAAMGSVMAEVERLKQRVAVLEKLVTDDDRRLSEEISRLKEAAGPRI
jgi:hypothetical protein